MNALVVEDSPVFRQMLRSILCEWFPGSKLCEAEGVEEGYARFREQSPDVVFVDIGLPNGNGLDLVKRIKQEAPATTVAVCTSRDQPAYEEAARACGADHFLSKKSLDRDQVAGVVRQARATTAGAG